MVSKVFSTWFYSTNVFLFRFSFSSFFSSDACLKHLVPDGNLIYLFCMCVYFYSIWLREVWAKLKRNAPISLQFHFSFKLIVSCWTYGEFDGVQDGMRSACQLAWTANITFSSILLIIIMRSCSLDAKE